MKPHEAQPRPQFETPLDELSQTVESQLERLNRLKSFFSHALLEVENTSTVNERFIAAGRADLVIEKRAEVEKLDTPEDVAEEVNFCDGFFKNYTGKDESIIDEWRSPKMIALSDDELDEYRQTGSAPSVVSPYAIRRPVFQRLLVLFPDFTKDLTAKLSTPFPKDAARFEFKEEMFVAYHIMSMLIDESDGDDLRDESGKIQKHYLCI